MPSQQALLEKGLETLALPSEPEKLLDYLTLLKKWNKAINLTAITDEKEMVIKHLLDSLSIAPLVSGERIIDVGTGGGLPGIPLAITLPNKQFVLCDSVGKKCSFLKEVVRVLALSNVEVVHSRIQAYKPEASFDMIISRALALASETLFNTAHLLALNGAWLFMKGDVSNTELKGLKGRDYELLELKVPFLMAQRHAILVRGLEKK